jgi:hypothetical protein
MSDSKNDLRRSSVIISRIVSIFSEDVGLLSAVNIKGSLRVEGTKGSTRPLDWVERMRKIHMMVTVVPVCFIVYFISKPLANI